jgi:precorrin-2 dehydrogenase / sirohydrochlorin ferrochelatase
MLPVSLDLARLPVVLVGAGTAGLRRLDGLDEAGAARLRVFVADPGAEWVAAAGPRLAGTLPDAADFAGAAVVFLAGLAPDETKRFADLARTAGALIHAEDRLDLTDLHLPAIVRRGELTIAVSTNGQSPALARLLKRVLAGLFGPEWEGRVRRIGDWRRLWRREGAAPAEIARRTEALAAAEGWLPRASVRPALLDETRPAALNH